MTNWSFVLASIFSVVVAYLLGSISFSIVMTRIFAGTDVRQHGSGNAGATNVLRTAGKLPAILTFLCDFLKCVAAVLFSILFSRLFHINGEYGQFLKYTAGIFCMVGHIYPLYFGFKGGRGVTAAAAIMLMLDWRCFLIGISIFIIITLLTRFVSLGSILAGLSIPFLTLFFQTADHAEYAVVDTILVAVISLIIITKHRENIVRLIHGTEPRMQSKSKS
jgi:glycerol-3-phosphate acyltransferase PlsY